MSCSICLTEFAKSAASGEKAHLEEKEKVKDPDKDQEQEHKQETETKVELSCTHKFHRACLKPWLEASLDNPCPICKGTIEGQWIATSYPELAERVKRRDEAVAAQQLQAAAGVLGESKNCPGCGWPYFKDGGCNWVWCRRRSCTATFCWRCLGRLGNCRCSWWTVIRSLFHWPGREEFLMFLMVLCLMGFLGLSVRHRKAQETQREAALEASRQALFSSCADIYSLPDAFVHEAYLAELDTGISLQCFPEGPDRLIKLQLTYFLRARLLSAYETFRQTESGENIAAYNQLALMWKLAKLHQYEVFCEVQYHSMQLYLWYWRAKLLVDNVYPCPRVVEKECVNLRYWRARMPFEQVNVTDNIINISISV